MGEFGTLVDHETGEVLREAAELDAWFCLRWPRNGNVFYDETSGKMARLVADDLEVTEADGEFTIRRGSDGAELGSGIQPARYLGHRRTGQVAEYRFELDGFEVVATEVSGEVGTAFSTEHPDLDRVRAACVVTEAKRDVWRAVPERPQP